MTVRVGINGFGRIGRILARIIHCLNSEIELVAINQPRADINQIKYDPDKASFYLKKSNKSMTFLSFV